MNPKAIQVCAPKQPTEPDRPSIFLAGTITPWREMLASHLSQYRINLLNPLRPDWDSSWREDYSDPRWAQQVEWELSMQEAADIIVVYFGDVGLSPISMLEFGLAARTGKAIVCAKPGFVKRGNVEAVCKRFGAVLVNDEEALAFAVEDRLQQEFNLAALQ